MSSNRLIYDTCDYKIDLNQSVSSLGYILNRNKYENCHKCRHEFGLIGGTAVSHIKGNIIDLENDLRGQTRVATLCPDKLYHKPEGSILTVPGISNPDLKFVDISPMHLSSCQMIRYPSIALPSAQNYNICPSQK